MRTSTWRWSGRIRGWAVSGRGSRTWRRLKKTPVGRGARSRRAKPGCFGGECARGVSAGEDEPAELLCAAPTAAASGSGRGLGGGTGPGGTAAATAVGDAQAAGIIEGGVGASGGEAGAGPDV